MTRPRLLLLLTAIVFASTLLTPSQRDLFVGDETKYGQVVREMRAQHEWLLPTLEGAPFTHKPPIHFWMIKILTYALGVYSTWAFAIPSILAFAFLLWLMWRMGGATAAFVCATSLLIWGSAQTARMDVSFTALITLGVWFLQRYFDRENVHDLEHCAIALGIATLIKGPMAIVIGVVLFALEWWRRKRLPRAQLYSSIGLLILVPLLWFVPAMVEGGNAWTHDVVQKQLAGRAVASWVHASPPWYYVLHSPAFLFPWFALAATAIATRWRAQRFNINWILAVLVPYSLMSSKLDVYMMALIPPVALLIADCVEHAELAAWRANVVMLALLFVIGAAGYFVRLRGVPRGVPIKTIFVLLAVASVAGFVFAMRNRFASTIAVGLVPLVPLFFITIRLMPVVNEFASTRPLIRALVAQHIDPEDVSLYSCPYLWARDMPHELERVHYIGPGDVQSSVVATSRRHAGDIHLAGYTKATEVQMIGKPFDVYRR